MDKKRAFEIMDNREICDVYFENHPVWIQEVNRNIAKIGFMDKNEELNVNVESLYEKEW